MAGVGPQVIQVLDFATARAPELQALHELAHHTDVRSAVADAKLVSQRNQRRRRANAFKSHKMPRRLKMPVADTAEEHIALGSRLKEQRKTTRAKTTVQQPRCRKHRRRLHLLVAAHSWLTESTADEEAASKWLSTHAWHAKRMLMREQYGHVLAQRRQDKSVSAALTALRTTATLHDVSYHGVLELYGLDTLMIEALQLVTDPSGSDVDDPTFFSGDREGQFVLYHANQFPSGAIVPASFMWRPLHRPTNEENDSERRPLKRQLWLWIHPAAFMEAASAIANACREVMPDQDGAEQIEILDRRGHLARLQLRGKQAGVMLDNVLRPISGTRKEGVGETSDHEDGYTVPMIQATTAHTNLVSLRRELKKHNSEYDVVTVLVADPRLRNSHKHTTSSTTPSLLQEPTVTELDASSGILCPLSGVSLTVGDAEEPDSKLILAQLKSLLQWTTTASDSATGTQTYPYVSPAARTPKTVEHDADVAMMDDERPAVVPCSELWSLTGRTHVRQTFLQDHELNRMKAQENTPSIDVPLMLVRQPGTFKHTGGWDLIMSPVYAPTFLKTLVFSGAMVIGLDEQEALATVAHKPSFPRDFPDTEAGRDYWNQLSDALENEYVKKPKSKRVAYDKLGVQSPFQPTWELLFSESTVEDQAKTSSDHDADEDEMENASNLCVLRSATYMEPFPFSRALDQKNIPDGDNDADSNDELIPVAVPTLIRVSLSFPRRAALEPCSMLYLPTATDLAAFHGNPKWHGRQSNGSELALLGFVTSAVYDRPMGAFRGTAFCACEPLQRLALTQLQHRKQLLALTRTPTSTQLRPVVLHVQV